MLISILTGLMIIGIVIYVIRRMAVPDDPGLVAKLLSRWRNEGGENGDSQSRQFFIKGG